MARLPRMFYRVYSTIDRGPTISVQHRYSRTCCHAFPVSKAEANKLAKAEMAKPYIVKVQIESTHDII
jgi:hypothetical protein